MKANNLTICIDAKCTKDCPYCISKMTWAPKANDKLFYRNLNKAVKLAELASVNSVLITSKGEPLNNLATINYCSRWFREFPLELQTNGTLLDESIIDNLYDHGINTIAISIDTKEDINKFEDIYYHCNELEINIRLTIVLTNLWTLDADTLLKYCKFYGIKQITFRIATIPSNSLSKETSSWIYTSVNHEKISSFLNYFHRNNEPKNLVRSLPFGVNVYDCAGIAVTTMSYCIQESNNSEDIRSLIYHQDGHLYTSWDKPSSILF